MPRREFRLSEPSLLFVLPSGGGPGAAGNGKTATRGGAILAPVLSYLRIGGAVGTLAHLILAVSLLFLLAPGLDLAVSAQFAGADGGFPLTGDGRLRLLRDLAKWLMIGILSVFAVSLLAPALAPGSRFALRPHKALFGLAVYGLGPLLLVNVFLKDTFGRARPREVAEFGGALDFSPVWQMSDACLANCSFTSGEAASAAAMLSIALLVPKFWRWTAVGLVTVPAVMFSAGRIAFGGHFLSDVLLSWLLVGLVMLLIRPLFFGSFAPPIDRAVIEAGAGLRRIVSRLTAGVRSIAGRPAAGAGAPVGRAARPNSGARGGKPVSRSTLLL